MKLYDKCMSDPNGFGSKRTTKEFIEEQISDMESLIDSVESAHNVALVGERMNLKRPRVDCKNMTNMQVVFFFSSWKSGLIMRYSMF